MAQSNRIAGTTLVERIVSARHAVNVSARELSVLARCADPHVGMIERGTVASPSATTLMRVARTLGVSLDWLLNNQGRPPSRKAVAAAIEVARAREVARKQAEAEVKGAA